MASRRRPVRAVDSLDSDSQLIRVEWPRPQSEFELLAHLLAAHFTLCIEGTRSGADDALAEWLLIRPAPDGARQPLPPNSAPQLLTAARLDCCWDLELFRESSRGPILWTDEFRAYLRAVIADRQQLLDRQVSRPMHDSAQQIAATLDLGPEFAILLPWLAVLRRYEQSICHGNGHSFTHTLQAVSGLDSRAMQRAAGRTSVIRRVGLMAAGDTISGRELGVEPLSGLLERLAQVGDGHVGIDPLGALLRPLPPAELAAADYSHSPVPLPLLLKVLGQSDNGQGRAPSILLHGPPGTGKSQLARLLGELCDRQSHDVPVLDSDDQPLGGHARLVALRLCQRVLCNRREAALLIFDEAEDLFPNPAFRMFQQTGPHKGWINQTLETLQVPTIWITNAVHQIDPAFLRRFELVVELGAPPRPTRERLLEQLLPKELAGPAWRSELAGHEDLSPDELKRLARVGGLIAEAPAPEREGQLRQVFSQVRHAQGRPLAPKRQPLPGHYRPDLVNASIDLERTAQKLIEIRQGRLCLYGPPGTGKTAWAQYLAERLGVPMLQKRASDLLGMYVGESEKRIAAAFSEAARDGALLLIDEADSLLQDRRHAQRSWELTQVNELLTQIEVCDGLLVICTNLFEALDPAALRRFDIRAHFDYLRAEQARGLLRECIDRHGIPTEVGSLGDAEQRLLRLDRLTPGDFQTVLRRGRLSPHVDVVDFVASLAEEQEAKRDPRSRPIGFHRAA